jgi:hypothetical protein
MSDNGPTVPPVPPSVEFVGEWEMTTLGRARKLSWIAIYDNVGQDANGDPRANTVRVIALQAATGDIGAFGVEIDVAASLAVGEALRVAASIRDAVDRIREAGGDDD